VSIRRTYTFKRGQYAISVRDDIVNAGATAWQGFPYRQLMRSPPNIKRGMTNPESFSLSGATWFGTEHGYSRRWFSDYDDGTVQSKDSNAWIAFVQHHFFSAWLPDASNEVELTLGTDRSSGGTQYFIRGIPTAPVVVPPGQQLSTSARLWVGPKLVEQIESQDVAGLDRVVDYSRFSIMAMLGSAL